MADGAVIVRVETEADVDDVDRVVADAFGRAVEAVLVQRIRASDRFVPELSLVAARDDVVVGHVLLSHVGLEQEDGSRRDLLSLAPLSVATAAQRDGIGSRLVLEAIARADERGEPLIVLEGSPGYYPRFGFEPARDHGIVIDLPDWAPPDAAMIRRLSAHDRSLTGQIVYPPAFDDDQLH